MSERVDRIKPDSNGSLLKFILYSAIGIILFFIPIKDGQVPIVLIVNALSSILKEAFKQIVFISCLIMLITYILSITTSNPKIKKHHESDGIINGILYVLAVLFAGMVLFNKGPMQILDPNVGGLTVSLAGSVMITISIAGWLVIFITKSGIVNFVGILLEPVMRPLFKLPGEAAVNALTSFVSAPAVAVYVTNKFYKEGVYTEKEMISMLTNFSICSIGFFGVLVSIGGIVDFYPHVVLTSLIITFIMGAIVIRIPPISFKRNIYPNGEMQTKELLQERKKQKNITRLQRAIDSAIEVSGELTLKVFLNSLIDAVKFTQRIIAFVLSVATIALFLAEYTQIFVYLGKPMIPYLKLFGIPDATAIAPSTIIGITELALPVMLVAGQDIAVASVFFVVVLSAVQIIFFAESAIAMLETDVPLNAGELILMFFIRTIIAIPLVALATKLLF